MDRLFTQANQSVASSPSSSATLARDADLLSVETDIVSENVDHGSSKAGNECFTAHVHAEKSYVGTASWFANCNVTTKIGWRHLPANYMYTPAYNY